MIGNGKSSEAHKINAGVTQDPLLGLTLFRFYINDLPKNTLRFLVNIYVDNTSVYGCSSKHLDDQCL